MRHRLPVALPPLFSSRAEEGEASMLALEAACNDEPLASVLNFIGERWHDWKRPVEAAEVARVRAETASRTSPWTHGELKELARRKPARAK